MQDKTDGGSNGASTTTPPPLSPEEFMANMLRALELGGQVVSKISADREKRQGAYTLADGMIEAGKVLAPVMRYWLGAPDKLARQQTLLSEKLVELWGQTYRKMLGEKVEPMIVPRPGDMRFVDREWSDNPFFDFLKQAYLLAVEWLEDMVLEAEVDAHTRRRAMFYLQQLTSALSPSNFPVTNPEVLRVTLSTNAENLSRGMMHLLEDLQQSGELFRVRQTDLDAFKVGRNLAITPGKVIYQNDIIQLIQYSPSTAEVYETPLLIVPPWINKYYILDLQPQKSFVKWLVDQGFTVFVISWVNPDARLAQKTFEDYMREGVLAAADIAMQAAGTDRVNAMGYCVGGTLLATALAHMAATGDKRINSASFLAAQTDFTHAGDLLVFIDDEQLNALEKLMRERGFLDGTRMASVFNMLRPRDLIWPYIVNNYLLGKQPFPFDLLYWNSDSTRMPPANHIFYLREFYQHNKLARGELELGGVKLDLGKVTIPIYSLATREDHIAPAESVLRSARLFGGPLRFVLSGSGHIAGVINPPAKPKYGYWVQGNDGNADPKAFASVSDFLERAQHIPGSWWPDYAKWLAELSGGKRPAREPGLPGQGPIEDAPGSYVLS